MRNQGQSRAIEGASLEHARKSNMLLTFGLLLLAAWAVGLAMSTTAGGLIHVALVAAFALFTLAWVRKVQHGGLI